jgi:predicted site-specific integrase-resolvase
MIGVNRVTLERWLADGKIQPPRTIRYGRNEFRNWTAADIQRVRKYKKESYRKGRGRKPKVRH